VKKESVLQTAEIIHCTPSGQIIRCLWFKKAILIDILELTTPKYSICPSKVDSLGPSIFIVQVLNQYQHFAID
jgi:hypothetical protein